jgi:hypothetical protein
VSLTLTTSHLLLWRPPLFQRMHIRLLPTLTTPPLRRYHGYGTCSLGRTSRVQGGSPFPNMCPTRSTRSTWRRLCNMVCTLRIDVSTLDSLSYIGQAIGIPPLQAFLKEYSARFYKPAYSDFVTLVHTGNTDGWTRVVYSLLNHGDSMLVEVRRVPL